MLAERWPQLRYHSVQAELLACLKRFIFLPCGRQSGKTELALRHLVMWLPVRKPWRRPLYFYAAPTLKQARRVAWDRLLELVPPQWIADVSITDDRIKTVFGSELFLDGLDKPERIEGQILDGGVVDENSDIKPGTYAKSIHGTLVTRHGWCWRIGVCKRFGVGAVEFRENCKKAANGELPNSAVFAWPSKGIVSEEELEIARAGLDERGFKEQYEATWLTTAGGIFYAFDSEFNVRPCSYDPNLPIVVGSDFNVNPMAWILGHIKGNTFEVFDEIWIRNTNTPATIDELLRRYGTHKGGFQMYGDASARGRHTSAYMTDYNHIAGDDRLRKLGRSMHYIRSNPPVADRFATTNARICSGDGVRHVFVDEKCKHLIFDLESRGYKPGTREADDSDKDQGHPTDALGYVLHKKFPLSKMISQPQTITITSGV